MPRIALTVGTTPAWWAGGVSAQPYLSAVRSAGGSPVLAGFAQRSSIEDCDGLLLTGGWDVHPRHMERMPGDENLTDREVIARYGLVCDEPRDDGEIPLIRRALELGMPIMGICRGIQVLNVVMGRKLIPDIKACVANSLVHYSVGGKSSSHRVRIEQESMLADLIHSGLAPVNSYHHQGLLPEHVAPGLRPTAIATDGIVEAVEGTGEQWILAVQWHPERARDRKVHELYRPLFREFVRQAKLWREERDVLAAAG